MLNVYTYGVPTYQKYLLFIFISHMLYRKLRDLVGYAIDADFLEFFLTIDYLYMYPHYMIINRAKTVIIP